MLVVLAKNKYVGITSAIVAVAALSNNVETIHLAGGYRTEGLYVNYDCRISLTTFAGRDAYINGVNRASETQWFVYGILQHSVSQLPDWIKHKQITGMTSANGNMTFEGLDRKKTVVLFAVGINDFVLIPYYQTPQRGLLGAHVVHDTASYSAITNTKVTADVYYFELSQYSVSQISNRVLLWSGTAGKGVKITIDSDYSFKEFKSFYCLTSIDKTIGLPLVRNSGIQQDQYLHGITGWDDGTTTWTLCGLIRINTETTATIISMSKHQIDGSGGVAGNLLKLWGYY